MKLKRLLTFVLAATLTVGTLAGCGTKNSGTGENTGDRDTYVIGLDPEFPPMGFKDADNADEIVGFDIDLGNAVAEEMGVTFKYQPIDWASKEMELDTGRIDMIWNGFTKTEEREENMTLTKAYLKNSQVIVVPQDSDIQTKEDLKGKNVDLQKDSSAKDAFDKEPVSAEVNQLTELSSNMECFQELDQGRADAMVVDKVVAKYYLSINEGKYRMLDDELSQEEYVIGVKKGNTELKEELEDAIQKVIDSGKGKEISEKWFGEDLLILE